MVIDLYAKGFVSAFDTYCEFSDGRILYQRLGWGAAEVPTLVAALEYAEAHCRPKDAWSKVHLDFEFNEFNDGNKAQLQAAIPANSIKFALDF